MINESEIKNKISFLIKKYRKIRGITQTELAKELEVSKSIISFWERGEKTPHAATLILIMQVLEIPSEEIFPQKKKENIEERITRIVKQQLPKIIKQAAIQ